MTGPLAGEPRQRQRDSPPARRAGSWLAWWVLMMSFWVMIDDSVNTDELLAGAGAAALAAAFAELVTSQAATRFRMRLSWLEPALSLPGQVGGDLIIVYLPLLRRGYEPGAGLTAPIQRFQSGVINDYVTWIVLGLAAIGGALALIIR
jgi:hypothetical protein